jgi:CheY-like chemotaxis protein
MTPQSVLYVEDDDNDVLLMRRAWTRADVQNPLEVVTDGEKALAYLSGDVPYANRVDHAMPCLVLLDLKMPKVSGLDVLRSICSQRALVGLRVIVFSSSIRPSHKASWHTTAGSAADPKDPAHVQSDRPPC